ncbi:MAG: alkaline phosphatase family protein [Oligoflexia bacterium]|nr:alkaline phosphatase family protein [Oligoflexia bacterium]
MSKSIGRRQFLKQSALGVSALACSGLGAPSGRTARAPYIKNSKIANKVLVLGMDGLDPNLLKRFMAEGILPTFSKFVQGNHFGELQTTMPPQSPVAWSSFISGTNPGGHGIFDFIHRDPAKFIPYLSTSRSFPSKRSISVGRWSVPLESGHVELMRKGPAFWRYLEDRDIDSTVFQIPGNFPVVESATRQMSGMGTPDLLGGYGTCSLYTDAPTESGKQFEGGVIEKVKGIDHVYKATLRGPSNPFMVKPENAAIELQFTRDPWEPVVKIGIQDRQIVLRAGEWSEWVPLSFEFVPLFSTVSGMVRFFVRDVHPYLRIYASPVNVDPQDASLPICSPSGYSRDISEAIGRFHTQGLPADTKALSNGILSDDEFLQQSSLILNESTRVYEHLLNDFREGFFFFYFSSVDQNCHMLMRNMDPTHPLYNPNASPEVKDGIRHFYRGMDYALARALERVDNYTTLMVLSDHGFAPFIREFHLSTWLVENGFTTLTSPQRLGEGEFYRYVDWSKSKAYALGINGIYINQKGREKNGWVEPAEADSIKQEIMAKLSTVTDPLNGQRVVRTPYDSRKLYSGPFVDFAPDIQVGYERGYRASDEAILGKFPKGIVEDRTNKWSSDHCMDPSTVPGVFLSNKRCLSERPAIWDMAPSILKAFGIETPAVMDGKPVLEV